MLSSLILVYICGGWEVVLLVLNLQVLLSWLFVLHFLNAFQMFSS